MQKNIVRTVRYYYVKAPDLKRKGNLEMRGYQEIARIIGLADYQRLFHFTKANHVHLRTGTETVLRLQGMFFIEEPVSLFLMAVTLYPLYLCREEEEDGNLRPYLVLASRGWFEGGGMGRCFKLLEILAFLVTLWNTILHWMEDSNNTVPLIQLTSLDVV